MRLHQHHGGEDGADVELTTRILAELPSSVDTVVIFSGDHYFVPTAMALQGMGKRVEVVAVAGVISRDLSRAADSVTLIVPAPGASVATSFSSMGKAGPAA